LGAVAERPWRISETAIVVATAGMAMAMKLRCSGIAQAKQAW
jgi:hypothetical protein